MQLNTHLVNDEEDYDSNDEEIKEIEDIIKVEETVKTEKNSSENSNKNVETSISSTYSIKNESVELLPPSEHKVTPGKIDKNIANAYK